MLRAWLVAFCCEVVVAAVRMVGGVGGGDSQPWYSATNPYLQCLFWCVFPPETLCVWCVALVSAVVGGGGDRAAL